jgi:hypothetical protein
LANCKSLSTTKLGALTKLVHAAFTFVLVFLGIHTKVLLRETALTVRLEEGAITTIENVNFGIVELGVAMTVEFTIFITQELGPGLC